MSRAVNGSRLTDEDEIFRSPKVRVGIARLGLVSLNGAGLIAAAILALAWFSEGKPEGIDTRRQVLHGEPGGGNLSLAVSPDGARIATTDSAGRVALWQTDHGIWSEDLLKISGFANTAVFSPDGRFLASGGTSLVVVELGSRKLEYAARIPADGIQALAFSPDGKALAATFEQRGDILIWDLVEGRKRAILPNDSPSTLSVAFSPDGRYLAAGGNGDIGSLSVWDLVTGACALRLKGHCGAVRALEFSPDGTSIATAAAYERCVRLWDTRSGRLLRSFAGHELGTNSLAFAPDGTILATVGNDGMGRLWKVATGELQAVLDGETMSLPRVAFSHDGLTLIATTGLGDNDVLLWDLSQPRRDHGPRQVERANHTDYLIWSIAHRTGSDRMAPARRFVIHSPRSRSSVCSRNRSQASPGAFMGRS